MPQERETSAPERTSESESEHCVFCDIIQGKTDISKIAETHQALAFMSLEGHPLVVPKQHLNSPDELNDSREVVDAVFSLARELLPIVKKSYGATGLNLFAALGEAAGQEVRHFHLHIIPRQEGDRKIRVSAKEPLSREELNSIAILLSSEFARRQR